MIDIIIIVVVVIIIIIIIIKLFFQNLNFGAYEVIFSFCFLGNETA